MSSAYHTCIIASWQASAIGVPPGDHETIHIVSIFRLDGLMAIASEHGQPGFPCRDASYVLPDLVTREAASQKHSPLTAYGLLRRRYRAFPPLLRPLFPGSWFLSLTLGSKEHSQHP